LKRVTQPVLVLALALVALLAFAAAPVGAANPGTVKVDDRPIDEIPDNSPLPGCLFDLEFFGFPTGTNVTYKFAVYPPTSNTNGPGTTITPPGVVARTLGAMNSNRLNLRIEDIDLRTGLANAGVAAHPQQGFHVKLTVKTPGGSKYKVFWVECEANPYR